VENRSHPISKKKVQLEENVRLLISDVSNLI
jgi:hypothetical protein